MLLEFLYEVGIAVKARIEARKGNVTAAFEQGLCNRDPLQKQVFVQGTAHCRFKAFTHIRRAYADRRGYLADFVYFRDV